MTTKPRKLKNLLEFKDREQVRQLLQLASGKENREQIDKILMGYITNKKWALHGFFDGPILHALIGLELGDKKSAEIQYIAVRPDDQKQGLATEMIDMAVKKHKLKSIQAETDSDADGFYKKLGFELQSRFTNEQGRERFHFSRIL